jgi:protein involved in polysaccharide export with SLBB domain
MEIQSLMTRCGAVVLAVAGMLLLQGCTDVPKLPPAPVVAPPSVAYLVEPGDTLDVKFLYNPELNDQPTVQPDGRISMLFAHDLPVAGKTVEQVRQEINEAYAKELAKPGVSVALKGAAAWRITVGGEVAQPNTFSNTGPTPTLTQIITRAGGIKDTGDGTKIVLLRRVNGKPIGYIMNFNDVSRGKLPDLDVELASYDAIYVPKTGIADVYTAYNQYFKQFLPDNLGIAYQVNHGS